MAHEQPMIVISMADQLLQVMNSGAVLADYPISTSRYGPGEQQGSECTPRGRHIIRACIGSGLPEGAVFDARRATGEIYSPELARQFPDRDWILTRILWLSGTEPGRNRSGTVDTMRRFIYIHGTPDCEPIGVPDSHGCIRMRNRPVIELFDMVGPGTPVDIRP